MKIDWNKWRHVTKLDPEAAEAGEVTIKEVDVPHEGFITVDL